MAQIERHPEESTCLACGQPLPAALERSGSLRCHDCRDDDAPLKPELVLAAPQLRLRRAA